MASLYATPTGQLDEFKKRLARAGLTAELIGQVLSGERGFCTATAAMVDGLKDHLKKGLVHGQYHKASDVRRAFFDRCRDHKIDADRFRWIGSQSPPPFIDHDPEVAVVLDATLDTLETTFDFAVDWAVEGQCLYEKPSILRSHGDWRPSLDLPHGQAFAPWTLRWRRLKFDATPGKHWYYADAEERAKMPDCALPFAFAQHPERVRMAEDGHVRFMADGLRHTLYYPDSDGDGWSYGIVMDFSHRRMAVMTADGFHPDSWQHILRPRFID